MACRSVLLVLLGPPGVVRDGQADAIGGSAGKTGLRWLPPCHRRAPAGGPQAVRFSLAAAALSKNSACDTIALTVSSRKGLAIRKVGSGRSPVSSDSG